MSKAAPSPVSTPVNPVVLQAEDVRPLNKIDDTLRESFAKDIADQAARLDELAKVLITLEIAIPGLYAALLKLVSGDKATLPNTPWTLVTFALWLLALGLTLFSLIPIKRRVDIDSLTDIEAYFTHSAERKLRCLIPASLLAFLGVVAAVLALYTP